MANAYSQHDGVYLEGGESNEQFSTSRSNYSPKPPSLDECTGIPSCQMPRRIQTKNSSKISRNTLIFQIITLVGSFVLISGIVATIVVVSRHHHRNLSQISTQDSSTRSTPPKPCQRRLISRSSGGVAPHPSHVQTENRGEELVPNAVDCKERERRERSKLHAGHPSKVEKPNKRERKELQTKHPSKIETPKNIEKERNPTRTRTQIKKQSRTACHIIRAGRGATTTGDENGTTLLDWKPQDETQELEKQQAPSEIGFPMLSQDVDTVSLVAQGNGEKDVKVQIGDKNRDITQSELLKINLKVFQEKLKETKIIQVVEYGMQQEFFIRFLTKDEGVRVAFNPPLLLYTFLTSEGDLSNTREDALATAANIYRQVVALKEIDEKRLQTNYEELVKCINVAARISNNPKKLAQKQLSLLVNLACSSNPALKRFTELIQIANTGESADEVIKAKQSITLQHTMRGVKFCNLRLVIDPEIWSSLEKNNELECFKSVLEELYSPRGATILSQLERSSDLYNSYYDEVALGSMWDTLQALKETEKAEGCIFPFTIDGRDKQNAWRCYEKAAQDVFKKYQFPGRLYRENT